MITVILISRMPELSENDLAELSQKVLEHNDRQGWTVPAPDLYPHQWLWDSCFIAIGLSNVNLERAQAEILNLLRGQWSNGMLPHIIFSHDHDRRERQLWRSYLSPYAPHGVLTSGLTQPPVVAEAVLQIGKKMKLPERRSWYRRIYPHLLRHHEWLYAERDPHREGLAVLFHPYESGLDNSPPWISELRKHSMPWWISLIEKAHLDKLVNKVRRDTRHVPPGQRMSNVEAIAYWAALARLRRKAYNWEALLSRSLFAVEDLTFNCILVRANTCLAEIASAINESLPDEIAQSFARTETALEGLWDETSGQYFSRSFVSHKLIEEPTIGTLLPLYAKKVAPEKAKLLLQMLKSPGLFGASWPLPSVPLNSPHFNPFKYWQGPAWINMNWMVIQGLKRNGFESEADKLKRRTIELVTKSGLNEYFNPINGRPAGASNFSWTAALTLDLIMS